MKAKLLFASAVLLMALSCSRDEQHGEPASAVEQVQREPLTHQQIKEAIISSLESRGSFHWKDAGDHLLWSAASHGEFIISVGFGSKNQFDRKKLTNHKTIERNIIEMTAEMEGVSADEVLIQSDPYLTTIDILIKKQSTLSWLRRNRNVRYVEPAAFRFYSDEDPMERSSSGSSGCGFESMALNTADFVTVAPNAKASWTFYQHQIPAAWNYSSGTGVTIGIVDTGVSPNQSLLGSSFNTGLSTGRTIQKHGAYVDSVWPWSTTTDGPNDQCGHGTSMASAAAAPRNAAGLPVGVAYNSNLISYRAASNVVLDGYHEQNGVKNAFTALGNNASVRIISMSMGHLFSVSKIEDGIKYAYSKGKLIFCAGGTSTSATTFAGVIFPASMAETIAVTGVKESSTYQKCNDCHSGSKIEFTIVMERAVTGNHAPVLSYYNNQTDYVGGSSVATATTAGIAALVWSKNPGWTRSQVLSKLRQSGAFYPNRHPEFGYGNINALAAVQ